MKTTQHRDRLLLSVLVIPVFALAATTASAQEKRARYVTIPVNGQIGTDTVPDGFTETFKMAARDTFNTVLVLTFDSNGGSEIDAERIIDIIEETGDRFERVGVVTQCIGPALGILLTCDRIYIADPRPEGTVMEFQAAWTDDSANNDQQLKTQQSLYRKLVADKPNWKPVIEAMIDPKVDLYAWLVGPAQVRTSNTRPDDGTKFEHIQLSEALGITAGQAIAAGLAQQLEGGMEGLGRDLGFDTFRPSATKGSVLMTSAVKEHSQDNGEIDATIDRVFKQLSSARALLHDLPRQQYFAEQADPRNMKYRTRYVRSWRGDRWSYTGSSVSAWRKNSDNAIQQWQVVINTLDRIGALGREARAEVTALQTASAEWSTDDERHEALKLLQKELDDLLSQGDSLQVMRDQAASQIDFFSRNRNNPVI